MGAIKGTELGLIRCPQYSIRSEKEEDIEEEKKGPKRKSYISMKTHSASILDGKPTFSVELCKGKHCICVQRAKLEEKLRTPPAF